MSFKDARAAEAASNNAEIYRRHRADARDASVSIRARIDWFTKEYGDLLTANHKAMLWSTVETFKGIEEGLKDAGT